MLNGSRSDSAPVNGPKKGIVLWLTSGSAASAGRRAHVAEQREHVVLDELLGVGLAAVGLVAVVERAQLDPLAVDTAGAFTASKKTRAPRFIWMPSWAAGPVKAADWPSTMRLPCENAGKASEALLAAMDWIRVRRFIGGISKVMSARPIAIAWRAIYFSVNTDGQSCDLDTFAHALKSSGV